MFILNLQLCVVRRVLLVFMLGKADETADYGGHLDWLSILFWCWKSKGQVRRNYNVKYSGSR